MKKRDIQMIVVLLLIAIIGLVAVKKMGTSTDSTSYVDIYVGDTQYERIFLNNPRDVVVDIDGNYNKVGITENTVKMLESSCDNQDCLHQGEITLENVEERVLGGWIVCLPNRVSIELIKGDI